MLETNLNNIPWDNIYYFISANEQLTFLQQNSLQLYEKHVPLITKKIKCDDKPWVTSEVKFLMKVRDEAYKIWKRYKTPFLREAYRQAKRKVVGKATSR